MKMGDLLPFVKYHGAGNDFILVDNRTLRWTPIPEQVARLCDRHFGIGADGLMILDDEPGYDFRMTYFNSDGRESTMCGNGGRCMAGFANRMGIAGSDVRFSAIDGDHHAEIMSTDGGMSWVRLRMKDACLLKEYDDGLLLDTGSPHFVTFVPDAGLVNVVDLGARLRYEPRFAPGGANIDFAEIREESLFVRTYERGVENETLSCGTGVTAATLAAAIKMDSGSGTTHIHTLGGELIVSFIRDGKSCRSIWLEGPAAFVFKGEIRLP